MPAFELNDGIAGRIQTNSDREEGLGFYLISLCLFAELGMRGPQTSTLPTKLHPSAFSFQGFDVTLSSVVSVNSD